MLVGCMSDLMVGSFMDLDLPFGCFQSFSRPCTIVSRGLGVGCSHQMTIKCKMFALMSWETG